MKILIISFTFPPQSGIGGRRWAKFAKYFVKNEHQIKVIAAASLNRDSFWIGDLEKYEGDVIRIPSKSPIILRSQPKSILQRIQYRLAILKMKLSYKGNYYDHSAGWGERILPAVDSLIAEGYTTIIASGGPFAHMSIFPTLKSRYGEQLKLISDFRDPWTSNKTSFGYDEISDRRLNYEVSLEESVIAASDVVVSVADQMTDYFKSKGRGNGTFSTLVNGFDPDEVMPLPKRDNEILRIAFVGTVYIKTIRHIQALGVAMETLQPKAQIQIDFYGEMSTQIQSVLKEMTNVQVQGKVSLKEAKEAIYGADVAMLILTDDITYSFSTKFCEYVASETPIWVISESGGTAEFVVSHNIGFHSTPDAKSINATLDQLMNKQALDTVSFETFDNRKFNVEYLASAYLNLIQRIHSSG